MTSALPFLEHDVLPRGAQRALLAGVLLAHAAAGWALLQRSPPTEPPGAPVPLTVRWITAPLVAPAATPAPQSTPKPTPAPTVPRPVRPARAPDPVIATVAPTPAAPAFVAPAPATVAPAEAPAPLESAASPPTVAMPPADPVPAAAAAPPVRTVPATGVQYLVPPVPDYPARSRRLGERGKVVVQVDIDATGLPRQVQLLHTSGFARLDDAALAAVRAARFRPPTENGVAVAVRTTVPIVFELEN